ncbi:polysaccharide biosynthesis protein, partial [Pelagibacteraceae bacterium]|nr:polysaccharide biosynthesis protein [Pelagibacteraceae bacterium]
MIKVNFNLSYLEKILISKKNRFKLKKSEKKKISESTKNKNLLIIGAAGSIGSHFVFEILKLNFKNLYLLDKDENQLTELNRSINSRVCGKREKIKYICSDAIQFDFKKFVKFNAINQIFNFSALKHVRTEENENSLKYMFLTNSANFLNFKMHSSVNLIFSVSTDKAINPTSMLGVSKKLMENTLYEISKKNKKIFVSSVRFTNVSFSNGSILKYVFEKLIQNQKVGVPENIKRYFITHSEAISLCLKAILKENKNFIILPSSYLFEQEFEIKKLSL